MTEEDKAKRAYIRSWYGNLPENVKNKKREYSNRYHTIIKVCEMVISSG